MGSEACLPLYLKHLSEAHPKAETPLSPVPEIKIEDTSSPSLSPQRAPSAASTATASPYYAPMEANADTIDLGYRYPASVSHVSVSIHRTNADYIDRSRTAKSLTMCPSIVHSPSPRPVCIVSSMPHDSLPRTLPLSRSHLMILMTDSNIRFMLRRRRG